MIEIQIVNIFINRMAFLHTVLIFQLTDLPFPSIFLQYPLITYCGRRPFSSLVDSLHLMLMAPIFGDHMCWEET